MDKTLRKFFVQIMLLVSLCSFAEGDTTAFQRRITELGIKLSELNDYSAKAKIKIAMPQCAYINITSISCMPTTNTDNFHAVMEVYDCQGNYFRKNILLNAQGNSSLNFPKKNFAVDFCEDKWIGDKTTDISIGDWVSQDAFHFKAYYNDTFRGIAVVGYKVFADMLSGRSTYQDRAGLTDYNKKARCFPDGFPCIVYLNGDFYGIYSWQLKKHRKNMSLEKNVATNIHLDGHMNTTRLWNDSIQWSSFEVRNPKKLYSQEPMSYDSIPYRAKEYDGDKPDELMDEHSQFYDPTNEKHVLSAQVKANIITFSKYMKEINQLSANNAPTNVIKSAIEERFDVPGMIDYIIFSLVTANYDGFSKNWQWFTYDAKKWFVTPYDLDCTFGYEDTAYRLCLPEWTEHWSSHNMRSYINNGPTAFAQQYYMPEIKARYAQLRDQQILTPERFMQYLRQWCDAIGADNYELEWEHWYKCRAHSEIITNDNWQMIESYANYINIKPYNADSTYIAGDLCTYKSAIWEATDSVSGIEPAKQMGYTDTYDRIEDWLTKRIALEDEYLEYSPNSTSITQHPTTNTYSPTPTAYYNLAGQPLHLGNREKECPSPGIYIIRMNDGTTRKKIR